MRWKPYQKGSQEFHLLKNGGGPGRASTQERKKNPSWYLNTELGLENEKHANRKPFKRSEERLFYDKKKKKILPNTS